MYTLAVPFHFTYRLTFTEKNWQLFKAVIQTLLLHESVSLTTDCQTLIGNFNLCNNLI